ncbi:hypothetical protein MNBD_GAMMA21-1081 [hydrothermal vent metagenome]|uniref:General secretion pathway GspH domain-containing protein n=1 Tax=hydrothermal vent metagenome TaxID=652676 RepID=A0A3B0ZQQ9_9ZZZZ
MIKKLSITTNMNTMKGLTLIELMVTLAVVAILVAIGLPRLQGMSAGNRMASTINSLAADLALARSEAINRNRTFVITASGGWANGWIVSAPPMPSAPTPINNFSSRGPVPNGMTFVESGGLLTITYLNTGIRANTANLVFTLCATGKSSRIININATGRYTTSLGAICP